MSTRISPLPDPDDAMRKAEYVIRMAMKYSGGSQIL